MKIWTQYVAFGKALKGYYVAYGGVTSVITSPIFGLSLAITLLSYENWQKAQWVAQAQSILPNMLGFSLGTYSVLLSLLSEKLRVALATVGNGPKASYLSMMNATFFHFIFVQIIALLWSFLYQGSWAVDLFYSLDQSWFPGAYRYFFIAMASGSFIGHLLLVYSLALTISAALAMYRVASLRDKEQQEQPSEPK
ncbi:hypothetical protein [Rhizobium sp. 10PS4]|uniref:hypothetical protein n=1 Tax=Rhizobium sp. 10PS4 TaxID=3075621 RepID=UPI0028FD62EF|nr:hypothetical protein [Rhizobium sp. 10PS4]MDU0310267.1 hypothetical protein [Rhizobium sp. 10PS4]